MKISLETNASGYLIQSHAPGEIRVRGPMSAGAEFVIHRKSIVVAPDELIEWEPQRLDDLAHGHLDAIKKLQPELILLGSGLRFCLPSPPLLGLLVDLGIGFEVMDTGAACRTYNLLAGEGRRVVAALLME